MVVVQAPGKLFFSGEWAVLEQGNPAIVLAVDSVSTVKLFQKSGYSVISPNFGVKKTAFRFEEKKITFSRLNQKQLHVLRFVKSAIETALNYLDEKCIVQKKFEISTYSKKNMLKSSKGTYQKVGFGSSAAITVATIAAILELHGQKIEQNKKTIYKLAAIAHFLGQSMYGSAADIAASTFGSAIFYKPFDAKWLEKELLQKNLPEIVEEDWPGFFVEELALPAGFEIIVSFSKKSASTVWLIEKMQGFKQEKKEEYFELISSIRQITEKLSHAIKTGEKAKILELVNENRAKLKELGQKSFIGLETKELSEIIETMAQFGVAAKFSGAGGGDCAIGVCFSKEQKQKIFLALKEKGLNPLEISISLKGVFRIG